MIVEPSDRAARSIRPAPVGAEFECPPLAPVLRIDRVVWRVENQRSRFQHMCLRIRIVFRVRGNFREGHMAGRIDKLPELAVRDWGSIDPEGAHGHAMNRRLFRVMRGGLRRDRQNSAA